MTSIKTYASHLQFVAITALFVLVLLTSMTTANAATLYSELQLGMSGAEVTTLQNFLASDTTIYPEGLVTGYFGVLTQNAVKRYQTQHGIPAVGRVGPMTLASINGGFGGSGGSGSMSGDVTAPVVLKITATAATTSAFIVWKTDEAVFGRVMYSTTWPFVYGAAPSVSSKSGDENLSQVVNLTGLQSRTTYYFVLESEDKAGNTTYSISNTFRTI